MIKRVESMSKDEDQPIMNRGLQFFEWAPGMPINDLMTVDEERQSTITNVEEIVDEHEH